MNYGEARRFDERNGNGKWTLATMLEMTQLDEYDVFIDRGEFQTGKIPEGFKKIKVHLIFAIKHDGRHKARMVADGHLTDVPLDSFFLFWCRLPMWTSNVHLTSRITLLILEMHT